MENATDKSNNVVSHMSREEKRLFNKLKEVLQVEDRFPASSSLKYSWDNRKMGMGRIMTHLDRIYTFKDNRVMVTSTDYRILGNNTHSVLKIHLPC